MQLWLSPYAQNRYWISTLEDPQYHTFPKLPMTKPSLNTEIRSKRDISKNNLILQCIKHKLILIEKVEKKRERIPKRIHWKLSKHISNEKNDPLYKPIINHIFFFLYNLEQKMILIFQMSTTDIKNKSQSGKNIEFTISHHAASIAMTTTTPNSITIAIINVMLLLFTKTNKYIFEVK